MHEPQSAPPARPVARPSRFRRRLAAMLAVLTVGSTTAACANIGDIEIRSSPDEYTCVIDYEDGNVKHRLPPGSERITAENDSIIFRIPTSNRFYNINLDRSIADDGAPAYIIGFASGLKEVQAVVHLRFKFNEPKVCDWVLNHGKRDAPDGNLAFNARLDPSDPNKPNESALTPWARWLNTNLAPAETKTLQPILSDYPWPHLEFNFPVNADESGFTPYIDCPDVELINGVCSDPKAERQPEGERTYREIEKRLGKSLSEELKLKLGDDYLCGVTFNPSTSEICPPIDVDIIDISLADQAPVQARKDLDAARDDAVLSAQQATIAQQTLQAKEQAKAANDRLREFEKTESVDNEAATQAELQARLVTAMIQAQIDNADCIVLAQQAGYTCAQLAAAQAGLGNQSGVTVQVTPPAQATPTTTGPPAASGN